MPTDEPITIEQWKQIHRKVKDAAERTSAMIRGRALEAGRVLVGGSKPDGSIFLYAHNWHGQSWMTPEQNRAARLINFLESKSWEPGTIADRISDRAYRRIKGIYHADN